jgi:hypothetical protein
LFKFAFGSEAALDALAATSSAIKRSAEPIQHPISQAISSQFGQLQTFTLTYDACKKGAALAAPGDWKERLACTGYEPHT